MQEFNWDSGESITKEIAGKIVSKCEAVDERQNNFLQFTFTDGSVLRIRYDWIYELEVHKAPANGLCAHAIPDDCNYRFCPYCGTPIVK